MKPYLLLDIDGVLVPFGGDLSDCLYYDDIGEWVRADARATIETLSVDYTIVWASAREETSNELARALDVGPFPYIDFGVTELEKPPPRAIEGVSSWKLPWIQAWADRQQKVARAPVVWVDDDAHEDATKWAEKRSAEGIPTVILLTSSAIGLDSGALESLSALVGSL